MLPDDGSEEGDRKRKHEEESQFDGVRIFKRARSEPAYLRELIVTKGEGQSSHKHPALIEYRNPNNTSCTAAGTIYKPRGYGPRQGTTMPTYIEEPGDESFHARDARSCGR